MQGHLLQNAACHCLIVTIFKLEQLFRAGFTRHCTLYCIHHGTLGYHTCKLFLESRPMRQQGHFSINTLHVVYATLKGTPDKIPHHGIHISQWLGKISFALYLIHSLWLLSVGCCLVLWLTPHVPIPVAYGVAMVVVLLLSLISAHYLTQWVDGPAVAIANRWGNTCFNLGAQVNQRILNSNG
jgi:hypothetical protein